MMRHLWFAVVILATFSGCGRGGSGPAIVPVSGMVIFEGNPIEGATVVFTPKKEGAMSMAMTDQDGKFVMRTGSGRNGAAVGEHDVTVILSVTAPETGKTTEDGLAPAMPNELGPDAPKPKPAKVGFFIPERYSKPGALSVTVPSSGLTEHKLELKK